jgi:hypothetical protein
MVQRRKEIMAISVNSIITDVHELGEDLGNKFANLWDTLMDDDNGISEDAYNRLVALGELIDPRFISAVTRYVDATDGRFYIKGNNSI